jgi:hypothetical protein
MSIKSIEGLEVIDTNQDLEIQHVAIVGNENVVSNQRLCDHCRTLRLGSDRLERAVSSAFGCVPKGEGIPFGLGVIRRPSSVDFPFCQLVQES